MTNLKLFLNSQYYPYGNLNLNFDQNQFALLYELDATFPNSYYGKDPEPLLNKSIFMQYSPLIVIDCSKQNESLVTRNETGKRETGRHVCGCTVEVINVYFYNFYY